MTTTAYTLYLPYDGCELYTIVVLPDAKGSFPTVVMRSPYEGHHRKMTDEQIAEMFIEDNKKWTENGFAFVFQDCRGTGKSTGDSDAFIYERGEGLALLEWIRSCSFYNGEIYLTGGSYCGYVNFSTAPYPDDIKAAVFEATDCNLYNFLYLNGFYRSNLHGGWYIDRYKNNGTLSKSFTPEAFLTLPMTEYSKKVFGERSASLDEMLMHPKSDDPFWDTPMGGSFQRRAVMEARIPMLITTGFFDIFCGGGHAMWDSLDGDVKSKSAFVVHPYHHGGGPDEQPYVFPNGQLCELMGEFEVKWFCHVRDNTPPPVPLGKVTYYELFDNNWHTDDYRQPGSCLTLSFGEGESTYTYDPKDPAPFKGGLSNNFGGTVFMDAPGTRADVVTCYTEPFENDVHVRGKMKIRLKVKSNRTDTAFYVRIGLTKPEGDFAVRDSITQISNASECYVPGEYIDLELIFDTSAFKILAGERLRVDVTSSAFPLFVPHTNNRGLFTVQTEALVAENTVDLSESSLEVFFE